MLALVLAVLLIVAGVALILATDWRDHGGPPWRRTPPVTPQLPTTQPQPEIVAEEVVEFRRRRTVTVRPARRP